MPRIIIDGKPVDCRPGIPVLQAALEAGWDVPHYCYHPGLSIVASCRLCLMEMKLPHPRTQELVWAPKLFPSCQTPVKDGLEVRFDSDAVRANQRSTLEYYLLNHPLDCPVCDKAGECYLQDYTEEFGPATSRMIEDKQKNPKKDLGSHTLLYQDRCVLCTRCVRFCDEIAGTGELAVVNRGSRGEIDVFPGQPLENPVQGNVVDLCPVGALLDKDFLFRQRVWLLQSAKSVSPANSRGETIWIDFNEQGVHRVRPRYNERVNEWWISDESRFFWKHIYRPDRLREPRARTAQQPRAAVPQQPGAAVPQQPRAAVPQQPRAAVLQGVAPPPSAVSPELHPVSWERLPELIRGQLAAASGEAGPVLAAVLSPMMACEEAWLLAKFIRGLDPHALLVLGHVPVRGDDVTLRKGFLIPAEKCPNRRGIETLLTHFGGPTADLRTFLGRAAEGGVRAAYVVGGYAEDWVTPEMAAALGRVPALIVHDLFPSALDEHAAVQIPGATWVEREGTFMNRDGLLQPFERARTILEGVKPDGQLFHELAGRPGLFRARRVREEMAAELPAFASVFEPQPLPEHQH